MIFSIRIDLSPDIIKVTMYKVKWNGNKVKCKTLVSILDLLLCRERGEDVILH